LMRVSDDSDGRPSNPLHQIRANATETSVIEAYRRRVATTTMPAQALAAAADCLRQLTPATVFAFYRYDKNRDVLICQEAIGDQREVLEGLTIALGTRVSGWSGATLRISVNADASLDLNQIATRYSPSLRSTLSVPIVSDNMLVGVFTAYANQPEAFQESDRYTFEQVVTAFHKQILRHSHQHGVVAFPLQRQ